jgi:hypothetical protein
VVVFWPNISLPSGWYVPNVVAALSLAAFSGVDIENIGALGKPLKMERADKIRGYSISATEIPTDPHSVHGGFATAL